mmetsp:Transcript_75137/g.229894  ORF Transcript_75137/g.229894 Transcript_75137/m.229894 type:complete len:227 (+) Transcript_75137:184-864(+)
MGAKMNGPPALAMFMQNVIMPMALPNCDGCTTSVMIVWMLVPMMFSPKTNNCTKANHHHLFTGKPSARKHKALVTPPNKIEPFSPVRFCIGAYKKRFTISPTTPTPEMSWPVNKVAGSLSPSKNSSWMNSTARASKAVKPTPVQNDATPMMYALHGKRLGGGGDAADAAPAAAGSLAALSACAPLGCPPAEAAPSAAIASADRKARESGKKMIMANKLTAQMAAAA